MPRACTMFTNVSMPRRKVLVQFTCESFSVDLVFSRTQPRCLVELTDGSYEVATKEAIKTTNEDDDVDVGQAMGTPGPAEEGGTDMPLEPGRW